MGAAEGPAAKRVDRCWKDCAQQQHGSANLSCQALIPSKRCALSFKSSTSPNSEGHWCTSGLFIPRHTNRRMRVDSCHIWSLCGQGPAPPGSGSTAGRRFDRNRFMNGASDQTPMTVWAANKPHQLTRSAHGQHGFVPLARVGRLEVAPVRNWDILTSACAV
jgi:hypothetical protein